MSQTFAPITRRGDTVVTYDDDQTNLDAIINAIRGAGYDAEPAA